MTGTTIGDLFVRLGLDATELNNGLLAGEKRLDRFGTQLFFLGSRITAGVSIPLGLALDKISDFGLGFDKAMTESLAIMDTAAAGMRSDMEGVAKSLVSTTKFSAEEGAKGFYNLASAGLDAVASMGALPIAAQFAQAGVMDLAKATDYLATAQAAMGHGAESSAEKVEQMARVSDVLTMANNRAIGTIQDFAEALTNKAGAALRQSNKTIEEGVAVLAAYAQQGIKGKEAGQQLWMSIRDLGIAALKHRDAFAKFNIAVFAANGSMRNMADIIRDVEKATENMSVAERRDMFIKLGMPSRSIAATNALVGYSDAIRDHQKALESAAGTTKEVADNQMQALSNQLLRLGNQFKIAAIDIFSGFVPVIKSTLIPLMESALHGVQALSGMIARMPDGLKLATLGVAALAVAIGPFVAFIGSMTLLTSAAARGLGVLASALGVTATSIGMTAGVSQTLAKFMAVMPTSAAAAAASAYDLAKAQGVSGVFLNRTATAAANAAGWSGKVTNALLAQGAATSTVAISTGGMSTATNLLSGGLTALLGVGTKVGSFILGVAGNMLKWYAIIELLTPAVTQLFSGWGSSSQSATAEGNALSSVWEGVSTVLGVANDAIFLSSKGLQFLVAATQDVIRAQEEQARRTAESAKKYDDLRTTMVESIPMFGPVIKGINDVNKQLNDQGTALENVKAWWLELKMFWAENGNDPINALNQQLAGMTPKAPKAFELPSPFKTKADFWMLGGQKSFEHFMSQTDPGGGLPEVTKKLTAAQSAAKNLADQWQENSKQARAFQEAWASLSDTQKTDASIMDHAWESYDKLRQTQGLLIPQFEKLFAKQIEQQEINKDMAFSFNEYSVRWSDAAIKVEDDTGKMYMALTNLRDKASLDAFWEKNRKGVEDIIPFYNELDPLTKVLVDRFQLWALRIAQTSGALEDLQHKASFAIGDYLQDTAAKLADAQTELTLFSKSYMDKELIGLKKGLAQQELARERSYRDQLKNLAVFANDPAQFAAELARLKMADANNKAINEAAYRAGLIRLAQSVGVNKHIVEDFGKMTNANIQHIIRQKIAQDDLRRSMEAMNEALSSAGSLLSTLGRNEAGAMFTAIASGMSEFLAGAKKFDDADTFGEKLAGTIQQIEGAVKAFQSLQQVGSRALRALGGAMTGAQIGNSILPGWGGIVGAGIGALAGAFMADPDWKMVQKTVRFHWNENVSKALADQIDKDADTLGGHVNAMMMHLVDIANEHGGIGAGNVGQWAQRLAGTFNLVANGSMSAAQGAKTLDNAFGELLKNGTTTDGLINDQIRGLVLLERQYRTGSAAITDFVDAQMSMVAEGFGKVAKGAFGAVLGSGEEWDEAEAAMDKLRDKILKLQAVIADFQKTPPTNEKQKVKLFLAQRDLLIAQSELRRELARQEAADLAIQKMAGAQGQEAFDRMGRLASVTFDAMIGSGKSFLDALTAIGPGLDTLITAQQQFGFASTDTFTRLMKFRDFANLHPELVDAVSGLQQMMVGLSNTGFLTQDAFRDLGAEITSTFNELQAQGLSGDEALQVMQPTLQTLWELQKKFHLETDEATQALIDQAVANGTVGEQFMSANDRMVLGIDKLIGRFDLLLNYWGIRIPGEAEHAAGAVESAFNNITPEVHVRFRYDDPGMPEMESPVMMAEGGVFMRPVVAGEAGPEAFMPLDRLFAELEAARQSGSGEGVIINKVYIDGRPVTTSVSRNLKTVLRNQGLLP